MTSRRALLGAAVPTLAAAAVGLTSAPAHAEAREQAEPKPKVEPRPKVRLPEPRPLARAIRAISTQDYSPAKVVVFGSSTTEGVGASRRDRRYVEVLESLLRRRPGGTFTPAGTVVGAGEPAVRLSGSAVAAHTRPQLSVGWAGRSVALLDATASAEHSFTGTSVQVVYGRHPGGPVLTISVDGTTVDVPTDGPLQHWMTWHSPPLPAGPHTITVTVRSAQAVGYLRGFRTFRGDEEYGVHVYEGGRSGWTSADYLAAEPEWRDGVSAIQPDLLVLQLGANDISGGRDPDVTRENLVSIVRKAQACQAECSASVIIVGSAQTTTRLTTQAFRERHTAMWQQAADQVGGVFLDPADVLPSPGTIGNLYGTDHVHLSDAGHGALGYLVASLLPMLPSMA